MLGISSGQTFLTLSVTVITNWTNNSYIFETKSTFLKLNIFPKVTGSGSTGTPASGTMTFSLPSDNSDLTNLNKTETGDAKTDTVLMVRPYQTLLLNSAQKI